MKRIMYGSVSVLCLALAFHLGAVSVRGEYVDHSSSGIVACWENGNGYYPWFLDENGTAWEINYDEGWSQRDDLPVPVSQVKFWSGRSFLTFDNHAWVEQLEGWVDMGAWPGGATATESRSWGQIKSEFR